MTHDLAKNENNAKKSVSSFCIFSFVLNDLHKLSANSLNMCGSVCVCVRFCLIIQKAVYVQAADKESNGAESIKSQLTSLP